jgi:TPR repeat protein
MKTAIKALMIAVAILVTSMTASLAQDFQTGYEAYQKGDYATALSIWLPLTEQGDAEAQNWLGVMYEFGDGVPQDDKEAVNWYRKAAEQGNAGAQNNLGSRYILGKGVIKNIVLAHMWYDIAASNGNKNAVKISEYIANGMYASQLEIAQELARECIQKNYKGCHF